MLVKSMGSIESVQAVRFSRYGKVVLVASVGSARSGQVVGSVVLFPTHGRATRRERNGIFCQKLSVQSFATRTIATWIVGHSTIVFGTLCDVD